MNSWEIIKANIANKHRSGTMGRMMEMNAALDLFAALLDKLSDREDAEAYFNGDHEVTEALASRGGINQLRQAGVLR